MRNIPHAVRGHRGDDWVRSRDETGIFNVADMVIMIGIAILAFAEFRRDNATRRSRLPRES
jgi:lipoprotein signal peptidase